MRERSVAEVKAQLANERRRHETIISRQSFYCTRRGRLVTPAECHDCFAGLSYMERLTRWNEDRMRCVRHHSTQPTAAPAPRKHKKTASERGVRVRRPRAGGCDGESSYSIEEYLCRGLLEFLLELDVLAERFETWWGNLAEAARARIHTSEELLEMVLWFGERLEEFRRGIVCIARSPAERDATTKEETCGVKNSPSTSSV